jgi:hypothetical protein
MESIFDSIQEPSEKVELSNVFDYRGLRVAGVFPIDTASSS